MTCRTLFRLHGPFTIRNKIWQASSCRSTSDSCLFLRMVRNPSWRTNMNHNPSQHLVSKHDAIPGQMRCQADPWSSTIASAWRVYLQSTLLFISIHLWSIHLPAYSTYIWNLCLWLVTGRLLGLLNECKCANITVTLHLFYISVLQNWQNNRTQVLRTQIVFDTYSKSACFYKRSKFKIFQTTNQLLCPSNHYHEPWLMVIAH